MKIKRVRLEDIESQTITGVITNTAFLKKVRRILKPEHFKSIHGGVVCKWAYSYYDKYEEAPGQEILRIFKDKKKKLTKEKKDLVGIYLKKLSSEYEKQSKYNIEYLYEKVVPFIRKRDIENLTSKINTYIENDRVDKANNELIDFQLVHKETSGIFNPFDPTYIDESFNITQSGILKLPGALGELIGPMDRGWLASFTAPEKRGKTWWLIEMAFQAIIQKLNVLFISLEMMPAEINKRMWKRLTAASEGDLMIYAPVVDCSLNQSGECKKTDRESMVSLMVDVDGIQTRRARRGYQPCQFCRVNRRRANSKLRNKKSYNEFEATYWYEKVKAKEFSKKLVIDKSEEIEKRLGSNLRVKCFPAFTANLQDIISTLNELDVNEGFAADVLIIDYLDICAPEANNLSERGSIDTTWKTAKGVSQQKKLLLLTVDQSSKITYEKDIRLADTSEDKRKNAHLDLKVAMNKLTPKNKIEAEEMPDDIDFLRFKLLAHRHKAMSAGEVLVLQQKAIGQPLIDCLWYK